MAEGFTFTALSSPAALAARLHAAVEQTPLA
jgi:hypothetical protein